MFCSEPSPSTGSTRRVAPSSSRSARSLAILRRDAVGGAGLDLDDAAIDVIERRLRRCRGREPQRTAASAATKTAVPDDDDDINDPFQISGPRSGTAGTRHCAGSALQSARPPRRRRARWRGDTMTPPASRRRACPARPAASEMPDRRCRRAAARHGHRPPRPRAERTAVPMRCRLRRDAARRAGADPATVLRSTASP